MSMEQIMRSKGKTDWEKVRAMTEEDIERAANSDPDAPLISKERLKYFMPVNQGSK
jgi:hypothetical protein